MVVSKYAQDPLFGPLLKDFVAELVPEVEALAAAAMDEDWPRLGRLSHKLKGEAATYGFSDLAQLAHDMEARALQPSGAAAADGLEEALTILRAMVRKILAGCPS